MSENYYWDDECKFAADAARQVGRPLLIRGEPGIGKSSLANAYARDEGMTYISEVVTAHTEANDLLWRFDGVRRLGDAHCCCNPNVEINLSAERYLSPGLLWWAFHAECAQDYYRRYSGSVYPTMNFDPAHPMGRDWVVLIDEIDKADSSVPNALLGALANAEFAVPHLTNPIALDEDARPLIVFTTNEDRELPSAFLRRCFVLHMQFPKTKEKAVPWLVDRALTNKKDMDRLILEDIADRFFKERSQVCGSHKPGLSEYLDLVDVLRHYPDKKEMLPKFVLDKNAPATRYFS